MTAEASTGMLGDMAAPKHLGLGRVLLECLATLGYRVTVEYDAGRVTYTAVNKRTGELFQVRSRLADAYGAACAFAEQLGIRVEGR